MSRCAHVGLLLGLAVSAVGKFAPQLPAGFLFDYNKATENVPSRTTEQCERIHIQWGRRDQTGPNPVAPYTLQIYASTFVVPFTVDAGSGLSFDWAVPFAPKTMYQICMFDAKGVSGGCQDQYTVTEGNTNCANFTFPAGAMDVEATVTNGPLSQYGFIPQCTDIQLTPKNGTPPYTLTIAPALHPPWNITSESMVPFNWTVALSRSFQFYFSVVDSAGNGWAQGPLHSGDGPDVSCLSLTSDSSPEVKSHSPAAMVGIGMGALLVGSLIGIIAASLYTKSQAKRHPGQQDFGLLRNTFHHSDYDGQQHGMLSPNARRDTSYNSFFTPPENYQVEPFVSPEERQYSFQPQRAGETTALALRQVSDTQSNSGASQQGQPPSSPSQERKNVYVVHHDGGRAPVTVYTSEGTEVVELPPRYGRNGEPEPAGEPQWESRRETQTAEGSARPSQAGHGVFEQRRQPGSAPTKPRRR